MKVDKKLVKQVADIARLDLSEKEVKEFVPQLKEVLEAFSLLDKIDTKGVKPSFHPVELKNVMREDKEEKCLKQEDALSLNWPECGNIKGDLPRRFKRPPRPSLRSIPFACVVEEINDEGYGFSRM